MSSRLLSQVGPLSAEPEGSEQGSTQEPQEPSEVNSEPIYNARGSEEGQSKRSDWARTHTRGLQQSDQQEPGHLEQSKQQQQRLTLEQANQRLAEEREQLRTTHLEAQQRLERLDQERQEAQQQLERISQEQERLQIAPEERIIELLTELLEQQKETGERPHVGPR